MATRLGVRKDLTENLPVVEAGALDSNEALAGVLRDASRRTPIPKYSRPEPLGEDVLSHPSRAGETARGIASQNDASLVPPAPSEAIITRDPTAVTRISRQHAEASKGDPVEKLRLNPSPGLEAQMGGLGYLQQQLADAGDKGMHPFGGLAQYKESINKAKDALEKDSKRMDLTGFQGLLKHWGVKGAGEGYRRPTNPVDKAMSGVALDEKMQNALNELSEKEAAFIKAQAEGKYYGALMRDQRSEKNQNLRLYEKEANFFQQQEAGLGKEVNSLQNIEDMLGSPNLKIEDVNRALSFAARALGQTGVLTEPDVARNLPRTFWRDLKETENYFTGNALADPNMVKGLRETLANARFRIAQKWYRGALSRKNIKVAPASPAELKELYKEGGAGEAGLNQVLNTAAALAGVDPQALHSSVEKTMGGKAKGSTAPKKVPSPKIIEAYRTGNDAQKKQISDKYNMTGVQ